MREEATASDLTGKQEVARGIAAVIVVGLLLSLGLMALIHVGGRDRARVTSRWSSVELGMTRAVARAAMGGDPASVRAVAPETWQHDDGTVGIHAYALREEHGDIECAVTMDEWTGRAALADRWFVGYDAQDLACWKGHGAT